MNIIPDYFDGREPYRVQISNNGHIIVVISLPVLGFTPGDAQVENALKALREKAKSRLFGGGARREIAKIEEQMALRGGLPLLFGTLLLRDTDGKECSHDMIFQNESEFPHAGSHVITVFDRVPRDELKARGFNKVLNIEENRAINSFYDEDDYSRFTIPAACVVDGRKYMTAQFEPFVHPLIVESFKDAQRV